MNEFKKMVTDKFMNKLSTNLEQGQGYIEDDVETLEEGGDFNINTETSVKTIMLQYPMDFTNLLKNMTAMLEL